MGRLLGLLTRFGQPRSSVLIPFIAIGLVWFAGDVAIGVHAERDVVAIVTPTKLAAGAIECERIAIGELDDYKPCIAQLPSGELLLTAMHTHQRENNKRFEQTLLFRSKDGGRTWSDPEKLNLLGREPYLSVTNDGTIFITGHLLEEDVRNRWGTTSGFLHRSADGGKTWASIRIDSKEIPPTVTRLTSRNVLELADGDLLLGVDCYGGEGPYFVWRSHDGGKSWDKTQRCDPRNFKSPYSFFGGETWLWQARSGKVWALVRADHSAMPMRNRPAPATDNDQFNHFVLFSSIDGGKSFDFVRDFGDYGEMYMSLLRLQDRRLLLTFTVRALNPPLGVRAIPGVETDDGFDFDFAADRIMLDTKTGTRFSGGGFGPTVQLKDGTLVTSYSYRDEDSKTRLEVVRWNLPAERASIAE